MVRTIKYRDSIEYRDTFSQYVSWHKMSGITQHYLQHLQPDILDILWYDLTSYPVNKKHCLFLIMNVTLHTLSTD